LSLQLAVWPYETSPDVVSPGQKVLTMLAVVALIASIHNQLILGSTFRACRLVGYVTVLCLHPLVGSALPYLASCSGPLPALYSARGAASRTTAAVRERCGRCP
jgi:hypothetical protein